MEYCEHIQLGLKLNFITPQEAVAIMKMGCPACSYELAVPARGLSAPEERELAQWEDEGGPSFPDSFGEEKWPEKES